MIVASLFTMIGLSFASANESPKLLQCPTVPEAYSKLITEVQVLKSKIKKDAACEPVQAQAQSLENLLGDRRKEVGLLVEKAKAEPLTDFENGIIRTYVEDLTTKVFSVVEMLDRNNYCFNEDRKKFSFSDLSALTLDATSLAQLIGGPWAMPISLGGQALAGVFRGMDLLVKNRRGFDFEKIEQRQSFATSLCTYYNYRRDMETLLDPVARRSDLQKVQARVSRQLEEINSNCPECKDLDQVQGRARLQAAKKADERYRLPLGSYSVKAQETLKWINRELERTAESEAPGTELGRDFLSEVQADVDRFFFEQQAPDFLYFQTTKTSELLREFRMVVRSEGELLLRQIAAAGVPVEGGGSLRMTEGDLMSYMESLKPALQGKGERQLLSRIVDHQRRSVRLFERVKASLSVQQGFCRFFEKAGFYGRNIAGACQNRTVSELGEQLRLLSESGGKPSTLFTPMPKPAGSQEALSYTDLIELEWEGFEGNANRFQRR